MGALPLFSLVSPPTKFVWPLPCWLCLLCGLFGFVAGGHVLAQPAQPSQPLKPAAVEQAAEPDVWLVMPLKTARLGALEIEMGAALGDLVGLELAPLDVVDRSRLEALIREQEISAENRQDLDLGKLVKANALVTGTLEGKGGDRLLARIRVVDVQTGVARHTVMLEGGKNDLASLAANLATELKKAEKVVLEPGGEGMDVEAARFRKQFAGGVAFHLSGDPTRAIPRFLSCLKTKPGHVASRQWLARSYLSLDSPLEAWSVLRDANGAVEDQIRKACMSRLTDEEILMFHERVNAGL